MDFFEGSSRGIPLLVKPGQCEKRLKTCLNVLDKKTKNNNCSTFNIPMLEENIGSNIWGSFRDWLILGRLHVDDNTHSYLRITLLNPFSREKVVLPKTRDGFHMVVLSSVPSHPRCVYMLVGIENSVAFWTCSDGHEEWLKCHFQEWRRVSVTDGGTVSDALYHDSHFYVLRNNCDMVVVDEKRVIDTMLLNFDCRRGSFQIAARYLELKKTSFSGEPLTSWRLNREYIVEASGDILLVSRMFYNNEMIILGRSCSRSFDATEELGDNALANNIYFSNNYVNIRLNEWGNAREAITKYIILGEGGDDVVDDWGVFRLEERRNETIEHSRSENNNNNNNWPRAFDTHPKHWAGIWVTAPIWWCLKQYHEHQTPQLNLLKHRGSFDVNRVRRATRVPRRSIRLKGYVTL